MTVSSFIVEPGMVVDVVDHAVACTVEAVEPVGAVRLHWQADDVVYEPFLASRGLPIAPPHPEKPPNRCRLQAWSAVRAHLTIRTRA